jgi:hypothetical protein
MNDTKHKNSKLLYLRIAFLIAILALCTARFFYLDADPPAGITWSTAIYGDERTFQGIE